MSTFLQHLLSDDTPVAGFLSPLLGLPLKGISSLLLSESLHEPVVHPLHRAPSDSSSGGALRFLKGLHLKCIDTGNLQYPVHRLRTPAPTLRFGVQHLPISNFELRNISWPRGQYRGAALLGELARPHSPPAPNHNALHIHPVPRIADHFAKGGFRYRPFGLVPVSAPAKRYPLSQNERPQAWETGNDGLRRKPLFPVFDQPKATERDRTGTLSNGRPRPVQPAFAQPRPPKSDRYGRGSEDTPPAAEEHHFSLATELAQAGLGRWGGWPGRALLGGIHGLLSVPAESLAEAVAWLADFVEPGVFERVRAEVEHAERIYRDEGGDTLAADIGDLVGGIILLAVTMAALIAAVPEIAALAAGGLAGLMVLGALEGIVYAIEQYAGHSNVSFGAEIGINALLGALALPLFLRIAKIARRIGPKTLGPTFSELIDRAAAKAKVWGTPTRDGEVTEKAIERTAERTANEAVGREIKSGVERPAARIADQLLPGLLDPAVRRAIEGVVDEAGVLRVGDLAAARAEALARIAAKGTQGGSKESLGATVDEGIYMFPDVKYGGWYVGRGKISERLAEHAREGRYMRGSEIRIGVRGSTLEQEIAEYTLMQEMTGGQMAKTSPFVSNDKDPIGPVWRRILGLDHPRK